MAALRAKFYMPEQRERLDELAMDFGMLALAYEQLLARTEQEDLGVET